MTYSKVAKWDLRDMIWRKMRRPKNRLWIWLLLILSRYRGKTGHMTLIKKSVFFMSNTCNVFLKVKNWFKRTLSFELRTNYKNIVGRLKTIVYVELKSGCPSCPGFPYIYEYYIILYFNALFYFILRYFIICW